MDWHTPTPLHCEVVPGHVIRSHACCMQRKKAGEVSVQAAKDIRTTRWTDLAAKAGAARARAGGPIAQTHVGALGSVVRVVVARGEIDPRGAVRTGEARAVRPQVAGEAVTRAVRVRAPPVAVAAVWTRLRVGEVYNGIDDKQCDGNRRPAGGMPSPRGHAFSRRVPGRLPAVLGRFVADGRAFFGPPRRRGWELTREHTVGPVHALNRYHMAAGRRRSPERSVCGIISI